MPSNSPPPSPSGLQFLRDVHGNTHEDDANAPSQRGDGRVSTALSFSSPRREVHARGTRDGSVDGCPSPLRKRSRLPSIEDAFTSGENNISADAGEDERVNDDGNNHLPSTSNPFLEFTDAAGAPVLVVTPSPPTTVVELRPMTKKAVQRAERQKQQAQNAKAAALR